MQTLSWHNMSETVTASTQIYVIKKVVNFAGVESSGCRELNLRRQVNVGQLSPAKQTRTIKEEISCPICKFSLHS